MRPFAAVLLLVLGAPAAHADQRLSGPLGVAPASRVGGGGGGAAAAAVGTAPPRLGARVVPVVRISPRKANDDLPHPARSTTALRTTGGSGGVSTQECVFFIFKLVVGSGAFCLPGVAIGTGTAACLAMTGIFAALAGYCFFLVGRCCYDCGAESFQELWERSGPPLRLPRRLLSWVIFSLSFGTCLQFSMSVGAALEPIVKQGLQKLSFAGLVGDARRVATLSVTLGGILPLVLMPDLESLRFTTKLGSYSFMFSALAIVLRSLDGTYAAGGTFFDEAAIGSVASSSSSSTSGPWALGASSILLLSSMSSAYEAHCDPPRYLRGMRVPPAAGPADTQTSGSFRQLMQFRLATLVAFAISGLVYATIIVAGRSTFGEHGVGDFLLSAYAPSDGIMRAAQLLTAFSMLCSYPLYFDALRKAAGNLFVANKPVAAEGSSSAGSGASKLGRSGEMALLAVITFLATCDGIDLLFVMSIRGALLGSFMLYILPPALSLAMGRLGYRVPALSAGEEWWLRCLLGYGVCAMVLGTSITTGLVGGGV